MGGFFTFLGPWGTLILAGVLYFGGQLAWQKGQVWYQKDKRQYCEAKLTDYEMKSKAALEKLTLERDDLKARLETSDHEHEARVAAMRTRHVRAFDSLSLAYADSCRRLSQAPTTASRDDGGAGSDELRAGTGRRLARVARIADEQAERLLFCQSYVNSLQGK